MNNIVISKLNIFIYNKEYKSSFKKIENLYTLLCFFKVIHFITLCWSLLKNITCCYTDLFYCVVALIYQKAIYYSCCGAFFIVNLFYYIAVSLYCYTTILLLLLYSDSIFSAVQSGVESLSTVNFSLRGMVLKFILFNQ